jgi:hypothetical protein
MKGGERKENTLYRVTMHFTDGNPVELLAEKPENPIGVRDAEGGLHKHVFTAPGGDPMPVYFDPGKLNAITVVSTDEWRRMPEVSGEACETMVESRLMLETPESVEVPSVSCNVGDPSGDDRPRPMMDVLNFLSRFVIATVGQLDGVRMERSFRAGRLRWGSETKRFPMAGWLARERLEAMRQDGLIRIDDPFYIRQNESVCVATYRGMARVGLGGLPPVEPEDLAHGYQQFLRTVDLYLAVMRGTRENAAWITSRELMSDEIRTSRENELGRSLPASMPSAHKVWPATPEGVLVLKERNVVAAIGLELTKVSKARLASYEEILDRYSRDPTIDRACFFFAHDTALQRVRDLAKRYRRDGFFAFHEFPAENQKKIAL